MSITGVVLLQADEELLKLSLDDLPGVGYTMAGKLRNLGLTSVADVRNSRKDMLQQELGAKSGSMVGLGCLHHHLLTCIIYHAHEYFSIGNRLVHRTPSEAVTHYL